MSDLIGRLSDLRSHYSCFNESERDAYHALSEAIEALKELPSEKPIIYCKDCLRHNVSVQDWYDNHELKVCPLVEHRGKAQGHEFDYQFCVYAERKEDE